MVNMALTIRCQIGLDFFEFLKETNRATITNKSKLREVYNTEFRSRTKETKDPNFGSVLYALQVFNKITRGKNSIRFTSKVKALYMDQWPTRSRHQSQPGQDGAASPETTEVVIPADEAETGVRARRSLANHLMKSLRKKRAYFISDKHGVGITSDYPFENGKLVVRMEETHESVITLNVKNTGADDVYFTYYTPLHWINYLTLEDEYKVTKQNPLALKPGDSYKIEVIFRCTLVGYYSATLAFEFKPDLQPSTDAFHIVRFFEAECITSLGLQLAAVSPYKPRSIRPYTAQPECEIVEGQKPEGLSVLDLKSKVQLKPYQIPDYVPRLVSTLKRSKCSSDGRTALLESPLSWENYSRKFQLQLYLEELQMMVDIRRYNIPNDDEKYATMTKDPMNKKLLVLEVPGVSENRPSVLRGDSLLAYPVGESEKKYRGYVHSVQFDSIKLGFSFELLDRFTEGMEFSVEFTINRINQRIQHRAAELAAKCNLEKVLFPVEPHIYSAPELPTLSLFNRQLEENPEQYRAVQHIVAGSSKPAPYLVFGPPGTGKTVTVVEAIKQIEKTQSDCCILACAPSNSAADLLCSKILDHVDQHKVYRMYASSRDPKQVPDPLKKCSNLVGDCYEYPAVKELMKYKIMVTTLLTAGRLVTGGIEPGHFTHVFVDEAGHAVETECLIPVAGLLDAKCGQVVLAGDPKQLGPILRSPFALKYGMGVSLLERLMNDFPLYKKNEDGVFNNCFVTKLLLNYRSHPAILKIPNELFYDNELQACADEYARNVYCGWEYLPQRGFPIIFHAVNGIDAREASSPSFFNIAEVETLMGYVRKLLSSGGKKGVAIIAPKDIGIIAPYRKQVQKIRKALEKVGKEFKFKDMDALKVGSVEEFQGAERSVILVSTVRSSPEHMEMDKKFTLGFVKNEKRFNVAVTRAKALLILVGNPRVLKTDPNWDRFIQYCKDEGGYTGYVPAEDDDDVVARLSLLFIDIKAQVETEESVVQQLLDPEWRNDL